MDGLEVISRLEALAAGKSRYFTGRPCIHGHLSERAVGTRKCYQCEHARCHRNRAANPEKFSAKSRERYYRDVEKSREKSRLAARRARRLAGQVPMAEYRALKRQEFMRREAGRAALREASAIARKEKLTAEKAARAPIIADRQRARHLAWCASNPGRMLELQRAWRARNREKRRAESRLRKQNKRQSLRKELLKLQRGRCAYCRTALGAEFHVDHIQPLKRGGPDRRSNLQLTCAPCNLTKSARDPVEFAQARGLLL